MAHDSIGNAVFILSTVSANQRKSMAIKQVAPGRLGLNRDGNDAFILEW